MSSIIVRRFTVPSKSRPYDAVCIPDKITSLNPLVANSFTSSITLFGSFEHTDPLAYGIVQKVQNLLHPSCIFKKALVLS